MLILCLWLAAPRKFSRRSLVIVTLGFFAIGASAAASRVAAALPLFGARADFATGNYPRSVAIRDLNGDGIPDLAVANAFATPGTVSVLLGTGNGTFRPKTDFATGPVSQSVAIGDLNRDGKPDLAVANSGGNTVSVLLGNGDGTFGVKTDYFAGDAPYSLAIGDLNGDGNLDLAVARWSSTTVVVLLGTGDGTFGSKTDFVTGEGAASVAIGDLNGDGKPDLAVANWSSGTVSVLLGNGDGTFGARMDFETELYSHSVAIGDLNGDGKPDLAVANSGNTVSVLLGNGNGTFGPKTDYAGTGGYSVAIGDLNGDGKPDLVVTTGATNSVSVRLGKGDGTFGAQTDYESGGAPVFVAIGDLNGDGKPDLVAANSGFDAVSVLLNISPDLPTPTLVEMFRAIPTAEGIRIEWQLSNPGAFQSIELQRSASETGEWSNMQQTPQVQGRVTSVLDTDAPAGQEQWYRLSGKQRDGNSSSFGPISAMAQGAVSAFALPPLSPNPSTGRSLVTFAVPTSTRVRLTLTDVQGREVAVLADGVHEAGRYTAALEASDLRAGIYFVCMRAPGVRLTRRLAVVK